jgi:hypothetical protein
MAIAAFGEHGIADWFAAIIGGDVQVGTFPPTASCATLSPFL